MLRAAIASRFTLRNLLIVVGVLSILAALNFGSQLRPVRWGFATEQAKPVPPKPYKLGKPAVSHTNVVSCMGPRGKRIADSSDDQFKTHKIGAFPKTFAGCYDALGLEEEWSTAEERYGPYGYNNDQGKAGSNHRIPVDWATVDWGRLQAKCQADNAHRFPPHANNPFHAWERRLRFKQPGDRVSPGWYRRDGAGADVPSPTDVERTGRTMLVLRSYGKYAWTEEDKINLRSLLSEAGLQSGGELTVMLFVNIRDGSKGTFESEAKYAKAFREAAIPEEFRSISVLWDDNLLKSWYPQVEEHSIFYQINQALQLLAVFYPEFDHFWQLEIDIRSLGHWATFLGALDRFGRNEPRKQMFERASYLHIPAEQGAYYPDFVGQVNASLNGGGTIWGPVRIPEIPHPVGPDPPVARPEEDNFTWGVGDDADVLVTSPCTWVFRMRNWAFRSWFRGPFSMKGDTPRITCPPAIQRASRKVLLAAHAAQAERGLAVPGEATFPSFALWHGLKLSFPPLPYFQANASFTSREAAVYFNGGAPGERVRLAFPLPTDAAAAEEVSEAVDAWLKGEGRDAPEGAAYRDHGTLPATVPWTDAPWRDWYLGFGAGEAFINQRPRGDMVLRISWWWTSSLPRRILNVWTGEGFDKWMQVSDAEPWAAALKEAKEKGDVEAIERLHEERLVADAELAKTVLRWHEGKWYAPTMWMHPAKTRVEPKQAKKEKPAF